MLQDAALFQLRLISAALDKGLMLKDASPYNVQWCGSRPLFIDIGSFERVRDGEPWPGYRQFCMLFLYPLLLEAYRGLPFQPWMRGRLDGIPPGEFRRLFTRRDALRPGMLKHVFLHASLERRNAHRGGEVRGDLSAAGFDARLIHANLDKLMSLVRGLRRGRARVHGRTTGRPAATTRMTPPRRTISFAASSVVGGGRSHGTSDATTAGFHASQPPART